ncbi:50S ribosomal protein L9 [Granulicella cerasi]|uniref:Large ribosomal subunit protein bL9 n=1 Tax=Granulicella cerasi TaxID=741063 RepID=A0ABW1Z9L5_9BACT|nr:50S ribosomal protein L9 [Granulicella cerasi]
MEVILKEDVQKLGHRGDVVKVADGYARNYLLPTKLAIAATANNKAVIEQMKVSALRKSASEKSGADELGAKLNEAVVLFERKTGSAGQLFGSVTSSDIAKALEEQGFSIDRRKIHLDEPLKTVGEYHIPVKIHREVTAHVQVTIKSDAPEVDPTAEQPEDETAFKSLYEGEVDFQRE